MDPLVSINPGGDHRRPVHRERMARGLAGFSPLRSYDRLLGHKFPEPGEGATGWLEGIAPSLIRVRSLCLARVDGTENTY